MAATAISLQLRPKRRPIANPNFLHFFSSSTPSDSTNADDQNTPPPPPSPQSPFSSYFSDVKASLKQNPPPPPQPQHRQGQSLEEIRRNLSQFHRPSPAPPPHEKSSPAATPLISFQELYRRRSENSTIQASNKGSGGGPSFDAIRESLRQLKINKSNSNNNNQINNNRDPMSLKTLAQDLNLRPGGPNNVIGGTDQRLPASVFGKEKEMREKERESPAMRTKFVRGYSYEELGKKLRMLRPPEGKRGGDWFSLGELNERLMKLREVEEKEEKFVGFSFSDLRQSLMTMQLSSEEKNKKQMSQRLDVLGQLGGTPNFMLSPPKDQLVEKYFHPDNMSSSEKMKMELQKVRDEFKMSESDCGSARVQVAQLTTKIKHLSTALDKKDKHSRKGLQAMVQRRKKLLKYLRRTDWDSYCLVLSKLGLRDNPDFKILTYPKKTA
ncbi:small ribosomal subunit protein uS15m [Rhododendron vialii]|uniref:small ribosomal subunit protein uS15m n=1 Tax=Rhododendron vialii TaxID=182163 RepID=UPI00265E8AEF|nr:small ribosomal subunit protein uS15m [Rhododendron vialii]